MSSQHPQQARISDAIESIKNTLEKQGLNRQSLASVLDEVVGLASHRDWWIADRYAPGR